MELLRHEQIIIGIVLPNRAFIDKNIENYIPLKSTINLLNNTIIDISWKHQIPIWNISDLPTNLDFDLLLVSCFPHKIQESLIAKAKVASVNIHPSILPEYKGPAPIFWQWRNGETTFGVTLHHLNSNLDEGDIVSQTTIQLENGTSGEESNKILSKLGSNLLIESLQKHHFPKHPQNRHGTYQSWPTSEDWYIPTTWPVVRAFNFIRGVSDWKKPFTITHKNKTKLIYTSTGYCLGNSIIGTIRMKQNGKYEIGFSDGWLEF